MKPGGVKAKREEQRAKGNRISSYELRNEGLGSAGL